MYADQAMYELGQLSTSLPETMTIIQRDLFIFLLVIIIFVGRAICRKFTTPAAPTNTTSPAILAQLDAFTKAVGGAQNFTENLKKLKGKYDGLTESVQTVQDAQNGLKKDVRSVKTDVGLIQRAVGTNGVAPRTSVQTISSKLTAVEDTVLWLEQQISNGSTQPPVPVQDPDVVSKLTAVENTVSQLEQQISKILSQPPTPAQDPQIMDILSAIMSKIEQLEPQPSSRPTSSIPSLALSSDTAQGTSSTVPSSPVLFCSTITVQTTAPTMSAPELSIAFGTSVSTAPTISSPLALSFAHVVSQSTEPLPGQQPELEMATEPSEPASQKLALSTVQTSYNCEPVEVKAPETSEESVEKKTNHQQLSTNTLQSMFTNKSRDMSMMLDALTGMELKATRTTKNGAKVYFIQVDEDKISIETRQAFNTMKKNIKDELELIADEHDVQLKERSAEANGANKTVKKLREEATDAGSKIARLSGRATKLTKELADAKKQVKNAQVVQVGLDAAEAQLKVKIEEIIALLEALSGINISPVGTTEKGASIWCVKRDSRKLSEAALKIFKDLCGKLEDILDTTTRRHDLAFVSPDEDFAQYLPGQDLTIEDMQNMAMNMTANEQYFRFPTDNGALPPHPMAQGPSALPGLSVFETSPRAPTISKQVQKTTTKSSPGADMVATPPAPVFQHSSPPTPDPYPDPTTHTHVAKVCDKPAPDHAREELFHCKICKEDFNVPFGMDFDWDQHEHDRHDECSECRETVSGIYDKVILEMDLNEHMKVCTGWGKGKAQVEPPQKVEASSDRDTALPLDETKILERIPSSAPKSSNGLGKCWGCSEWLPRTGDNEETFHVHLKTCEFKVCTNTGCDLVVLKTYYQEEETGHKVVCKARKVAERQEHVKALITPTIPPARTIMDLLKKATAAPSKNTPPTNPLGGATTSKASVKPLGSSFTFQAPPRFVPKTETPASGPMKIPGLFLAALSNTNNIVTASTAISRPPREVKNTVQKTPKTSSILQNPANTKGSASTKPSPAKEVKREKPAVKVPPLPASVPQFFSEGKNVVRFDGAFKF